MESSKSSPLNVHKLEKPFRPTSDPQSQKISVPDPNPWAVKTPGKAADPPRRLRHRSAAMSIKEVRQAALKLRESGSGNGTKPGPFAGSAGEDYDSPIESTATGQMKKKSANAEIKLPEKYELLEKFFNSMDSSIRLLQLKRSVTSFTNVKAQVECLTDRRFTHSHLAQLKFIMPDAIEIGKILQYDERTSCMKPDLRITLNVEAIGHESNAKSDSRNLQLRKVFRVRLMEFFTSHPEGDDIPEDALPEQFNRPKQDSSKDLVRASASSSTNETPDMALLLGEPAKASHLPLSFRRSFSQPGSVSCAENLNQEKSVMAVHTSVSEPRCPENPSNKANSSFSVEFPSEISSNGAAPVHIPLPAILETPGKSVNLAKNEDYSSALRTPVELCSTPAKLMHATPMIQPPKRCCRSPNDDSSESPSKLVRRPPPNRPLKFDSPVKSADANHESTSSSRRKGKLSPNYEIFDILPEALIQSIQEKEKKLLMEQDPAISQAKWRRQMIAKLPKLFEMIYFLFQSIRRTVLTKEELVQKIISGHLDVVDRKEVEEQLRLMQELVPEWIYEKTVSSGDLLVCINKISSPKMIRAKLAEAK